MKGHQVDVQAESSAVSDGKHHLLVSDHFPDARKLVVGAGADV